VSAVDIKLSQVRDHVRDVQQVEVLDQSDCSMRVLLVPLVNIKIKPTKPGANPIVMLVLPLTLVELNVLVVQLVNIKMKTAKPGASRVGRTESVVLVVPLALHVQAAPHMQTLTKLHVLAVQRAPAQQVPGVLNVQLVKNQQQTKPRALHVLRDNIQLTIRHATGVPKVITLE
jgi:hypothetical protein